MLQCVAVCCSVLQCVAVYCSVLQYVAVCCSVLQCAAVCCSVLQSTLDSLIRTSTVAPKNAQITLETPRTPLFIYNEVKLLCFCWTKPLEIQQKKISWRFKFDFPIRGRYGAMHACKSMFTLSCRVLGTLFRSLSLSLSLSRSPSLALSLALSLSRSLSRALSLSLSLQKAVLL